MGDLRPRSSRPPEVGARDALRDDVYRAARAALGELDADIDDWVVPIAVSAAFRAASVDDLFRVVVDHVGVVGVLVLLSGEPGVNLSELDPTGRWTLTVDTTGDERDTSPR